jgi:hypothetical protein
VTPAAIQREFLAVEARMPFAARLELIRLAIEKHEAARVVVVLAGRRRRK